MSEEPPSINKKEIADQALIDALRAHGPEDLAVKEMLALWVVSNETELNIDPTYASRVEMDRRRGRLLFEAGYIDEAFESLSMAATQANSQGNQDLYDSIMSEMDQMDAKLAEQ